MVWQAVPIRFRINPAKPWEVKTWRKTLKKTARPVSGRTVLITDELFLLRDDS